MIQALRTGILMTIILHQASIIVKEIRIVALYQLWAVTLTTDGPTYKLVLTTMHVILFCLERRIKFLRYHLKMLQAVWDIMDGGIVLVYGIMQLIITVMMEQLSRLRQLLLVK